MKDGIDYLLKSALALGVIWIGQIVLWIVFGWPTLMLLHWVLK